MFSYLVLYLSDSQLVVKLCRIFHGALCSVANSILMGKVLYTAAI